jgi:cytochrome c oxidase assembly protein subunit 15
LQKELTLPMSSLSATLSSTDPGSRLRTAARVAWAVLAYMLGVILWGAYVRASGSGAGCGNQWPLCGGEVIPTSPQTQMLIEYTHRITSGLALVSVIALLVLAWRATVRGAWARKAAVLAVVFMLNEALLGALLVLLRHVGHDASVSRAIFLSLHLANTLLLIASIALTARWLTASSNSGRYTSKNAGWIILGLLVTIIIGVSGALAALGDTLFPATSLRSSLTQDFSTGSYYLLRLRLLHPVIAVSGTLFVIWIVIKGFLSRSVAVRRLSAGVIFLATLQVSLGILNVLLLAPIWLQMTHLLVGDLLWIALVLFSDQMLLAPSEQRLSASA